MHTQELREKLVGHPDRTRLVDHRFFAYLQTAPVSRELAAQFVGQWWHPLHYFPTFLSRTIAVADQLVVKTATSLILFQELGEGRVDRAHEQVYISTMRDVGFTLEQISGTAPFPATAALLEGYRQASQSELGGIGFIYATEVADLAMVSAIGTAVRRATGATSLPWVEIHEEQEPAHRQEADVAISAEFSSTQVATIMTTAERAWSLWVGFFDALEALVPATAATHRTQPLAAAS
jgi:pyrroloquinoline quinone (PQQ) biosynthesis protein C